MPALISHTKDQIKFGTTADERGIGLLLIGHGACFAGFPPYALIQFGAPRDPAAWLLLLLLCAIGVFECRAGLATVLNSERLTLDLVHREYFARRGWLMWGETFQGSLDEFKCIRVTAVRGGRRGRTWDVDWVWRGEKHPPFRVSGWVRVRSFRLAPHPASEIPVYVLATLTKIAHDAGVPLNVPDVYIDRLGVADPELDAYFCPNQSSRQ